jgi:hypothetical protein
LSPTPANIKWNQHGKACGDAFQFKIQTS